MKKATPTATGMAYFQHTSSNKVRRSLDLCNYRQAEHDARVLADTLRTMKSGLTTYSKVYEGLQGGYNHFERALFQREFFKRLGELK